VEGLAPEHIADILTDTFGEKIQGTVLDSAHPHVRVRPDAWPEVAKFLRGDPRMKFNMLRCISSVDQLEDDRFEAVYDLDCMLGETNGPKNWSRPQNVSIKISVPRSDPHIPSVADVWPAADWHEREAYDLMGIVFDGHPDSVDTPEGKRPRRILCPDDWEGHPLRKDYAFPMEYHGIPAVTEYGQTRPVH
jgi:NADH-quinone oxidoreductase subunit C